MVELGERLGTPALRNVAGTACLGGREMPHGQQRYHIGLLAPHQDGIKQGRRCNHAIWSGRWTVSGPLSLGRSQQDYKPCQYLLWYSGHVAEQS